MSDGLEAAALVRDLCLLLKSVGTCSCRLEEGTLRVDANISVRHKDDRELGTRTEVKNLNSMKAVTRAVDYEIRRQIALLTSGQQVTRATMRFNSVTNETEPMRDKESVDDYKFMPEANLPMILLKDSLLRVNMHVADAMDVDEFRRDMPPSPQQQREQLMRDHDIDLESAMVLMQMPLERQWFQWIMQQKDLPETRQGKIVFRILCQELQEALEACKMKLDQTSLVKEDVARICDMVQRNDISYPTSQDLLSLKARQDGRRPEEIVIDCEWDKIVDESVIRKLCEEVIADKPKRAKEVRNKGKKFAFEVMVEEAMKKSHRRIDRETVEKTLIDLLQPPAGLILNARQRKASPEQLLHVLR